MSQHWCNHSKMDVHNTTLGQLIFLSKHLDHLRFRVQYDIYDQEEHPFCRQHFCAPARIGQSDQGFFHTDVR